MLKHLRAFVTTVIIGKDFYIETLNTPEVINYEIHYAGGRRVRYGTKKK